MITECFVPSLKDPPLGFMSFTLCVAPPTSPISTSTAPTDRWMDRKCYTHKQREKNNEIIRETPGAKVYHVYICFTCLWVWSALKAASRTPDWLLVEKENRSSTSWPSDRGATWTKPPDNTDTLRTAWHIKSPETWSMKVIDFHMENPYCVIDHFRDTTVYFSAVSKWYWWQCHFLLVF